MRQHKIPATFMRGGTSKAIVFNRKDLPEDRAEWNAIFLAALGSPDPNGRQLDGMGGGISSLSKICVVGPSSRPDADVDYTFAQVAVDKGIVGYGANCGNMSSAIGPFAIDEGMVEADGSEVLVRIYNTNTKKIIHARFALDDGMAAVEGDFKLPGVGGTGAPVRLEFREPGGAGTGKLLPTGNVVDRIEVPGLGPVEVSLVDAANPCVFVLAETAGVTGTEGPAALDGMKDVMGRLESVRARAAVLMGIAKTPDEATRKSPSIPFVGMVAPPKDAVTLAGAHLSAADGDLTARMVSSGNTHRALPLTGALCTAVAARIEGTLVHRITKPAADPAADIRILQPSGVLAVACTVRKSNTDGGWVAEQAAVYRTQRRLFEGRVLVPLSRLKAS
ncbi:MAG: PrpF family protein [Rhodospirillales bacterium]|nr:PrpF family protein [Rhodospirillales bacterium]